MIAAQAALAGSVKEPMRLRVTLTEEEGAVRLPRSLAAAAGLGGEVEFAVDDGRLTLRRPGAADRGRREAGRARTGRAEDDRCRWD